jgi:hypothetical protein
LPRNPMFGATLLVLAMTAALLGSFGVKALTAAAGLQVLTRFLANYTKQEFDDRGVALAGSEDRIVNDRVAVMMRFIGMVLGPLWFGTFQLSSRAMMATILVMMTLSVASAFGLKHVPETRLSVASANASSLKFGEYVLIAAAIGIYAQYYLLAANIVYVLERIEKQSGASALAGVLITTVYATAMAVTIATLRFKRQDFGLLWMLPAPLLMFLCGMLLNSSVLGVRTATVAASAGLGLAFALYLLALRNHVTSRSRQGRWLAFFNNLANTSALAGFSVMAVLVAVSRLFNIQYATLLSAGLCLISLITVPGAIFCRSKYANLNKV